MPVSERQVNKNAMKMYIYYTNFAAIGATGNNIHVSSFNTVVFVAVQYCICLYSNYVR